jgi:hypothetical protein
MRYNGRVQPVMAPMCGEPADRLYGRAFARQDDVVPAELNLFADYRQIHVFDEGSATDLGEAWTDQAASDRLPISADAIAIGTEVSVNVLVGVEVLPSRPTDADAKFDHVVEASLRSDSGRLVVMGCTDYEPDAARFAVPAGWLRLRVAKSNLDQAYALGIESDEVPETMERLRIQVWPAEPTLAVVVKQWSPPRT